MPNKKKPCGCWNERGEPTDPLVRDRVNELVAQNRDLLHLNVVSVAASAVRCPHETQEGMVS